jgi:DNA-binding NarL/FixJ family response regulator
MAITVLLADDHRIVREGLRALLEKHDDIQVVGEAEDGRVAVNLAKELEPDIVVMDVTMPNLNGMEAARQIISYNDQIKVIVLSMHSKGKIILQMFEAGVSGYLLKENAAQDLVKAIRVVARGDAFISQEVSGIVFKDYVDRRRKPVEDPVSRLSPREREVVQLLSEGQSTRDIASLLCLSVKTVESHRRNVMQKLNIDSIAELTKFAIQEGITTIDQ